MKHVFFILDWLLQRCRQTVSGDALKSCERNKNETVISFYQINLCGKLNLLCYNRNKMLDETNKNILSIEGYEGEERKKMLIEFKDVVKTYGLGEGLQVAVDHISFTIEEGEFVVILGQSGAGKSTVLNMLGGMDVPTQGSIMVFGKKVSAMNDKQLGKYRADTIGFIFQFYNLLPSLTAKENIALTKSIVKDARDADELLKLVGLSKCRDKFPAQMSGGEQQRVSIARALAKNPKILLGDEPTGALDSETGVVVLELLQNLCRAEGKTVILVTHNADIAKCADKVIRMKNGKIREIVRNEQPLPVKEVEW